MTWARTSAGRAVMGLVALYAAMIAFVILVRTTGYEFSPPVRLAIVVAVAVPAVWLVARYWSAIDELAREAQKWAWFWGGTTGMGLGLLALSIKPLNLVSLFPADTTPFHYLAYGGMTVMLFQVAGFTVAWIYWWATRR